MVRVETYRGTPEALAEFVGMVWTRSYSGKMSFPKWTPDYFRWQFRWKEEQQPENLLAAYEGDTLLGVMLGTDYSFDLPGRVISGSLWSWLSIHPDHRGLGIAKALDDERVRRQQAKGAPLIVSYRFVGSQHSQAERPHSNSPQKRFHTKLGTWVRVLDAARFARWSYSRMEGLIAHCTVPFAPRIKGVPLHTSIQEYSPQDLDSCLVLLQQSQSSTTLGVHWTRESLSHHLSGSPVSQTLILRENNSVVGLINFHVLPFQARTIENIGIIDLIAFGKTSLVSQARLIRSALTRMDEQQVILALKLRSGDTPIAPLLMIGFAPQPASSFLVLQFTSDPIEIFPRGPMHLLWR